MRERLHLKKELALKWEGVRIQSFPPPPTKCKATPPAWNVELLPSWGKIGAPPPPSYSATPRNTELLNSPSKMCSTPIKNCGAPPLPKCETPSHAILISLLTCSVVPVQHQSLTNNHHHQNQGGRGAARSVLLKILSTMLQHALRHF